MRKRLIQSGLVPLIFLLLGWVSPAAAQVLSPRGQLRDSLVRVYDARTIYGYGDKYIMGGKQVPFRKLKTEFTTGITSDLYRQGQQDRTLSHLLSITSVVALVGSSVLSKNHQAGSIALQVVGIGLNLGSLRFSRRSNELVDRALWQRNRDILFGGR